MSATTLFLAGIATGIAITVVGSALLLGWLIARAEYASKR